ncbi:substrate-binding domain-containing protein [Desulfotignum phosphitoxidans]|uniref:ABC-type tungstate/vanadate transporter, periplasmic substrate binding protein TupA n=1 Tax=Desulfotignum phosphitoxidans DSM 13687 TaxID=1286635 RepID=S0G0Y9_9BACT|nr:substrate-binding domain-containing protein [Desulfotignum phosphitoxidans]EMS81033.1 ABC-type tungstate/vanadate transporter, periplasmic substrate binding protein TupA [Desulfotignum phosphitoxidans DSM 13687]
MKDLLKSVVVMMMVCLLTAPAWGESDRALMMATTTSTDNTGLLEYLVPEFTRDTGIEMKWVATGTGNALKLGENCDVDVLMVHAPAAEKQFVENGFGLDRKEIMFNDFVIIGPASDPAQIKGRSVSDALNKILETQAVFVSRGDNSGTHKKELFLWKSAELPVPEAESWYVQAGQGMLATINMAGEKNGYTMTDRGTYIKYEHTAQGNPQLKILVEGDDFLKNQYSVMAVNPNRCENVNYEAAVQFSDWITGEKAQNMIGAFKLLDKILFIPNAR